MPLLRIETARDPQSDRFYLELFYPADTTQPYVTTAPRYQTAAAAEGDFIACLAVIASRQVQS